MNFERMDEVGGNDVESQEVSKGLKALTDMSISFGINSVDLLRAVQGSERDEARKMLEDIKSRAEQLLGA